MVSAENKSSDSRAQKPRGLLGQCQTAISNLLIPPTCLKCQIALPPNRSVPVCDPCQSLIADTENLPYQCPKCSARLRNEVQNADGCRFCSELNQFPFRSVTSLGNYQGQLRELVILMKSRQGQNTSLQLGDWLAEATLASLERHSAEGPPIDLVVPMPSHWMRRFGRGHNVANLLAESFARNEPFRHRVHRCLQVTRRTRKQGTLTMNQRFENVKGSLQIHPKKTLPVTSKPNNPQSSPNVLLLDDVMTSGATAIQAAKVLQQAGAGQIHLAVVARAIGRII